MLFALFNLKILVIWNLEIWIAHIYQNIRQPAYKVTSLHSLQCSGIYLSRTCSALFFDYAVTPCFSYDEMGEILFIYLEKLNIFETVKSWSQLSEYTVCSCSAVKVTFARPLITLF